LSNFLQAFKNIFPNNNSTVHHYFAPGRLNFIGEHLDYNGGTVMPFAIHLGIHFLLAERADEQINFYSKNIDGMHSSSLKDKIEYDKSKDWANYPLGVVSLLQEKLPNKNGWDIYIESDLPTGAGLSSSAAIEVVTAFALNDLHHLDLSKLDIAFLAKQAENEFIGVACGVMDQYAVTFGKAGHLLKLNCDEMELEEIPFSFPNHEVLIINTNTSRKLENSFFNERQKDCVDAAEAIKSQSGRSPLAHCSIEDLDFIKNLQARKRAKHVITEQTRVNNMRQAIDSGIDQVAELLKASHLSLRNDFEVTGPILDAMFDTALNIEGCIAARMTGAGFAGCGLALVEKSKTENFCNQFIIDFEKQTGHVAELYKTSPQKGVRKIDTYA